MNNKRKITIIVSIVCTLVLLLGGTYAAWNFLTEKTNVTMLVGGDQISFDAGENITVTGMLPVYSMEQGVTKDITIYKENGDYTAGIDLYLNLTSWSSYLSSASFRWAVYKNGEYLSSGDFSGKSQGNNIKLTSYTQKINLEENKDEYRLYLWIDAYQESDINMMKQEFTVNVYGQVSFYTDDNPTVNEVEPNAPDLADGMIPIKYNYVLDEWVKADVTNTDNDWYDYYNKKWANAVMVTTETREEYMNADIGTTISNDDILAYYVWIPRYKYLLFNVESEVISPIEIQIEFQKETDEIFNGTQNGQYLTHPAFWWDNDSDGEREEGEELAGIWIGKFQTGGTSNNPIIKPNVSSIMDYIKPIFDINKKFQELDYLTDIGSSVVDSHMIKNIEWGAVSYLSHSKYGKNSLIYKNDNSAYLTGRQGNYTYNDFYLSNLVITPNKEAGTGVLASTTGNVYGIYDMAGIGEWVMGVMKNEDGGIFYSNYSGFNDSNMVESKYYDLYEYGTSDSDFTRRKLGDATAETRNWYNTNNYYVGATKNQSWFLRGQYNVWYSGSLTNVYGRYASHSVLIIP